jgi:hypothetical protein
MKTKKAKQQEARAIKISQDPNKQLGIQIDNNIPIPDISEYGTRMSKYPIATIEKGQSFFVEMESKERAKAMKYNLGQLCRDYSNKIKKAKKQASKAFLCLVREELHSGETKIGVRCWRVK